MSTSTYTKDDVLFLKNLVTDIANELCECDCCKKENGCSIFERMYIAINVLFQPDMIPQINLYDTDSCIDWATITQRVNTNSAKAGKFIDKSRKKILSRFYFTLYMRFTNGPDITSPELSYPADPDDKLHVDISRTAIFGNNAIDIITNCLDECCNQ